MGAHNCVWPELHHTGCCCASEAVNWNFQVCSFWLAWQSFTQIHKEAMQAGSTGWQTAVFARSAKSVSQALVWSGIMFICPSYRRFYQRLRVIVQSGGEKRSGRAVKVWWAIWKVIVGEAWCWWVEVETGHDEKGDISNPWKNRCSRLIQKEKEQECVELWLEMWEIYWEVIVPRIVQILMPKQASIRVTIHQDLRC